MATLTHWAGHLHWTGRWFRAHTLGHHVKLYPIKKFVASVELICPDENSKFYIPTLITPGLIAYFYDPTIFNVLATLAFVAVWLLAVDYFHAACKKKESAFCFV